MALKKLTDGRWLADIEPVKGKRHRKTVKTKAEALRFEAHIRARYATATAKDWNPAPDDKRRFSELIELWYGQHGVHLAKPAPRKSALERICKATGNPVARKLSPQMYLRYRQKRTLAGISPKTLNNELGYINAMYSYLFQTDQIDYASPLSKVKPIRIKERELSYLETHQINELMRHCYASGSRSLYLVVRICLETGCRWNESQQLKLSQVGKRRITFTDTKSGKNRTVPISEDLEATIRDYTPTGQNGKLFAKAIKSFYRAVDKCSFELPRGQSTHVLRHTFASHFMMNGGDILTLQRILGHSTITLTMRYSHLSPDHLQDAIQYRPVFDTFSTPAP